MASLDTKVARVTEPIRSRSATSRRRHDLERIRAAARRGPQRHEDVRTIAGEGLSAYRRRAELTEAGLRRETLAGARP